MSSREYLDMDNLKNGEIKENGYFVQKWLLLTLAGVFIACVIIVGLLASHLKPCPNAIPENLTDDITPLKQVHPYSMLPRSIIPVHYTIELQPFLIPDNFTFNGFVKILVKVLEDTDNLTLHINEINILRETVKIAHMKYGYGDVPKISEMSEDKVRQFFILHFSGNLKAGNEYEVEMRYVGILNDHLSGFYRSSYKDSSGNTRWLAVTQFEPTDARKAFPCFDEPALKAQYSVTIIRWKNMTSLSNMPKHTTNPIDDDWEADIFNKTVPMSTYLVAFLVSDFKSQGNSMVSVWSKEDSIKGTQYAADIAPKILTYFEEFFGVQFPLPKMDMAAIPDFSAGAMENWGLITYRETSLLYDADYSSANTKKKIATTVAHELAHQWFGNLVTMKWWDDLWLNEGFASYVEYIGTQAVEPDWQMDQQFVLDDLQDVLDLDALKSSHPISVPVGHPDEINEIFDRISYGKGSSVIRMMKFFLGDEVFKKGLSNYLNDKKYSNAVQDELWNHLTEAQGKNKLIDVKTVMDSWTLQTGYPVVTITRDYTAGTASITQTRFLLEHDEKEAATKWEIPLTYTDSLNPDWEPKTKLWLHKTDATIGNLPGPNHWVIGNVQQVGFYRVNYDKDNWEKLIRQFQDDHNLIHVINRAQILDDSMDLARAGLLNYTVALDFTKYLNFERNYIPWRASLSSLSYITAMLSKSEIYGKWKKYLIKKLEPVYEYLTWEEKENESILVTYLRSMMINWLCDFEHKKCVDRAKELFQKFRTDPSNLKIISPNHRFRVYCTAVADGGEDVWNFVYQRYLTAQVISEKTTLMSALTCAKEPWLISRFIQWCLSTEHGIRKQNGAQLISSVGLKLYGQNIVFNFVRDQWDKIYSIYGKQFFAFSGLVKSVTANLNTEFEYNQLKQFYVAKKNQTGSASRAFQQSLENVDANVKWMKRNYEDIKTWLDSIEL